MRAHHTRHDQPRHASQGGDQEELEVNIDQLADSTLWQLDALLRQNGAPGQVPQRHTPARELNGPSRQVQPCNVPCSAADRALRLCCELGAPSRELCLNCMWVEASIRSGGVPAVQTWGYSLQCVSQS